MPKAAHPTKLRDRWRIRWLDEHGERQSAVFDTYKEAEYQLGLRKVEAEERRRGLRAAAVEPKKFDTICTYWLEKRAVRKRSQADDESIIKRHVRPAFGHLPLGDVGVEEVDGFVVERDHLNPKTVANHLTLLISLLRLAHELGWLAALPRIKKPKVQLFSTDFRYLRTKEEVRRFLAAAREDDERDAEALHALYATAVLTGLRAGELAALRWEAWTSRTGASPSSVRSTDRRSPATCATCRSWPTSCRASFGRTALRTRARSSSPPRTRRCSNLPRGCSRRSSTGCSTAPVSRRRRSARAFAATSPSTGCGTRLHRTS
jgi:integrase